MVTLKIEDDTSILDPICDENVDSGNYNNVHVLIIVHFECTILS